MFIDEDMKVRFRESVSRAGKGSGVDWLLSYEGKPIHPLRKFASGLAVIAPHRGVGTAIRAAPAP